MQQIGKDLVLAGTILSLFGGTYAQIGSFLIQAGTTVEAGNGTAGPIRVGSEGLSLTVAPWQG